MINTKVVIVEDELITAEYLKEILQAQGVEVLGMASSGKEAIEICKNLKPDVVFMDIMLSDNISGCEAAVEINHFVDSKIIFLTAYLEDEMVDYAVEANAVAYLTKPYNQAQILATLRLAIQSKQSVPPKATQEYALAYGYMYYPEENRITQQGKDIDIGKKGMLLIKLLCTKKGKYFSEEEISYTIWHKAVSSRTLRSLIRRVRQTTHHKLIKNVSGLGYKIVLKEDQEI